MKILFIRSPRMDYVQDLTYLGLAEILGRNNIRIVNGDLRNFIKVQKYPRNLREYTPSVLSMLAPMQPRQISKFDAVIVGACKVDALEYYLKIQDRIPSNVPIIFLDGGDEPEIGGDLTRYNRSDLWDEIESKRPFDLIFKREYLLTDDLGPKVHPIPMCVHLPSIRFKPVPKKYDATFWAGDNNPVRAAVLQLIQDKWDCAANGTMVGNSRKKFSRKGQFYLQELSASKVAMNFRGTGWDTLRYWEIPAVGAFMLSGIPKIRIANNFEHEKHAVFCADDLSDLEDLTNYYLKNEDKRERIALAGKQHLLEHHTTTARARQLLSLIPKY